MKYFFRIGLVLSILLMGVFFVPPVSAASVCECILTIKGKECNVSGLQAWKDLPKNLDLIDFSDSVNKECPPKKKGYAFSKAYLNSDLPVEVKQKECSGYKKTVSYLDHTHELTCAVKDAFVCCLYYKGGNLQSAIDNNPGTCPSYTSTGYTSKKTQSHDPLCKEGLEKLKKSQTEAYEKAKKAALGAAGEVKKAVDAIEKDAKKYQHSDLLTADQAKLLKDLNQFTPGTTVQKLIGRIIKTAMGLLGTIAFAMFIYGGFLLMMGSTVVGGGATKQDISKAKDVITWAVAGMFVIFSSYAIVDLVFDPFESFEPAATNQASTDTVKRKIGSSCTKSTQCESGECKNNKCVDSSGKVQQCSTGKDCDTGICSLKSLLEEGVCTDGKEGTVCLYNSGCAKGLICSKSNVGPGDKPGTCEKIGTKKKATKKKDGESCSVGSECKSNICNPVDNKCTNGKEGVKCQTDISCASDHICEKKKSSDGKTTEKVGSCVSQIP